MNADLFLSFYDPTLSTHKTDKKLLQSICFGQTAERYYFPQQMHSNLETQKRKYATINFDDTGQDTVDVIYFWCKTIPVVVTLAICANEDWNEFATRMKSFQFMEVLNCAYLM